MILYPAIDLKDGRCVRLVQGDMDQRHGVQRRPGGRRRANSPPPGPPGFTWSISTAPSPASPETPRRSRRSSRPPRPRFNWAAASATAATIKAWLDQGVARVVLGTAAVKNPDLVKSACRRISRPRGARHRCAPGQGRGRRLGREHRTFPRSIWRGKFEDAGAAAIIYTDIERDGALAGRQCRSHGRACAAQSKPR